MVAARPISRPITIAVAGTHSTGKSTFLAKVAAQLRGQGLAVATVSDLGEAAQRAGLPILTEHTWASTLWIITRGLSLEIEAWPQADVVLVDRPIPDALGYYRAALDYRHEPSDPARMTALTALVRDYVGHYDLIYRTVLDRAVPLGDNKPRDTNREFRALADWHVADVLADLDIPATPLTIDGHTRAVDRAIALVNSNQIARTA